MKLFKVFSICLVGSIFLSGCGESAQIKKVSENKTVVNKRADLPVVNKQQNLPVVPAVQEQSIGSKDEIVALTKDDLVQANMAINAGHIVWQERSSAVNEKGFPAKSDVMIVDQKDGLKQKLAVGGNDKNDQFLPMVNSDYGVWVERPHSEGAQSDVNTSLYYSSLGKLNKKLLATHAWPFGLGSDNSMYYLDNNQKKYPVSVFNLKTGRHKSIPLDVSKYTVVDLMVSENGKVYFVGPKKSIDSFKDDNTAVSLEDNKLFELNEKDGSVKELYDFGPLSAKYPDGEKYTKSLFAASNNMLAWVDVNWTSNVAEIKAFDFKTQKIKSLVSGLKRGDIVGQLQLSDEYIVWATYSEVKGYDLLAYNIKNNSTHSVLKNTKIKLADLYESSTNVQKSLYGNKLVIPGYEGELDSEYKNVEMYLVSLLQ